MNRNLIKSISFGYAAAATMVLLGVPFNEYVMLFISSFAAFLTLGQFFCKAMTAETGGVIWQERVKSVFEFLGNSIVLFSVPMSIILTFIVVNIFPNNIGPIANASTLFSLAIVFGIISIFED